MNLILFQANEWGKVLGNDDPRARHILTILKSRVGDSLKVGLLEKGSGLATLNSITEQGLTFDFPTTLEAPRNPLALRLIIGHVRPIVMQRIFKDLASLGVLEINVINAGLSESSYFKASFWHDGSLAAYLKEGACQGGELNLPHVQRFYTLKACLEQLQGSLASGPCLACHPGAFPTLSFPPLAQGQLWTIAIGPERGWTTSEIASLAAAGFQLRSMGSRILRSELAITSVAVLAGLQ